MPSEPYVATVSVFQDPPAPYTPREGDVIERGRTRIVLRSDGGHVFYASWYKRSLLTGMWNERTTWTIWKNDAAALVNHMGWRLLPRGGEA